MSVGVAQQRGEPYDQYTQSIQFCVLASAVTVSPRPHRVSETGLSHPAMRTVVDCFETQVRLHPKRIAVKIDEQELSYEELNRCADRVAHRLMLESTNRATPVALCCQHCFSTFAAFLGILKAGRFCVPLDPSASVSPVIWGRHPRRVGENVAGLHDAGFLLLP